MSTVTNVVAVFGLCSQENDLQLLDEINLCGGFGIPPMVSNGLKLIDKHGGSHGFEANVASGAWHALDIKSWVLQIRRRVNFDEYGCDYLQFIVCDDRSNGFGVIDVWSNDGFDPFVFHEKMGQTGDLIISLKVPDGFPKEIQLISLLAEALKEFEDLSGDKIIAAIDYLKSWVTSKLMEKAQSKVWNPE